MKTKLIFILLSCFFSSILYAETITVISTPPTINGVQGTPTENTLTRAKGKVITITAKPKVGFKGVIAIDGVVIASGKVDSVVRHKYTIEKDAKIEISYTDLLIGVFLDAAVEGIKYQTSSGQTGITNAKGEFQYKTNDDIKFSVGDIYLGTTVTKNIVTVFDLDYSLQVAQLLQTFDEDNKPSNGINITKKTSDAMTESNNISVKKIIDISEFNSENSKSNNFVKDVVKRAELSERQIVSRDSTINHAKHALSEQIFKEGDSQLIKWLLGSKNFNPNNTIHIDAKLFSKNAKARVNYYAYYYLVAPLIRLEDQRSKGFYSKVDKIKNKIEMYESIASVAGNIKDIAKGLKNINNVLALKNMNLAGAGLLSTGYSQVINEYGNDNTKAIFAGLEAMKSCGIGAITSGTYKDCVTEAVKSIRTIGFAISINIARVRNDEFQLADELLQRWVGCGRSTSCMSKKYLNNGAYSHKAILKNLAGDTSFFTNDPNIDRALKLFNMFDKIITNYVTDIENIFGDLNKFNSPLSTPQNVTVTAGNGKATITWDSVTDAESYNLYHSTFSLTSEFKTENVTNPYILKGLTSYKKYYLTITSEDKDGKESALSNVVAVTPHVKTNTTGKLNDTGITWGGNYPDGNNESCVGEEISAQDCSHGRDAQAAAGTLKKIGAGAAGFDFTKLDANGASLPASASQWSCVKDNHTGLIWEVKTDDEGIHDKDNSYKWGGKTAIGQKATTQFGTYYDDWNSLVDGSNTERLCGYSDWRVPNINELRSIVHYGTYNPAIDTQYFPNTTASGYWSSSPNADSSNFAWGVYYYNGYVSSNNRNDTYYVRVVRSGQ